MRKISILMLLLVCSVANAADMYKINPYTGKFDNVGPSPANVGIGTASAQSGGQVNSFAGYIGVNTIGPFQTVEVSGNVGIGTTVVQNALVVAPDGNNSESGMDINFIPATAVNGIDSNTKLMLHMDDAGLTDSELTPKTITLGGNVARSSTQSKFGGFSAVYDGSGDYLSAPDSTDWPTGTNDFTIDFWVYFTNSTTGRGWFGSQYTDGNNFWGLNYGDYGANTWAFVAQAGGVSSLLFKVTVTTPSTTWMHIELVRSGSNWYFFKDGVSQSLSLTSGSYSVSFANFTSAFEIGRNVGADAVFNGYIDEYRYSNSARHTSGFTPNTAAYDDGTTYATPQIRLRNSASASTLWTVGSDGNDSNKFKISTSSLTTNTRMAIDSNGNVGIGSATPGQVLDVQGTVRASSPVHASSGTVSLPGYTFTGDVDSGMYSGGANDLRLGSGGVNALTINSSQNIGIGTITPIAKLQMAASGSPSYTDGILFTRLSNSALGFGLWYSNSGSTTSYIESRLDSASASMNFRMRAAGTPVEAMTILGSGNIGIGTSVPGAVLDVHDVAHNEAVRLRNQWGSYVGFGGTSSITPYIQAYDSGGTPMAMNLQQTSGNVGIGTAIPGAKLEVNGDIMGDNRGIVNDRTIGLTIDGGGSAITTGHKGYVRVPYACVIQDWFLNADQSGSLGITVQKDSTYPPTTTICGTECPTISSNDDASDTSLSSWTTAVSANDYFGFNVGVGTTITRATLTIKCKQ